MSQNKFNPPTNRPYKPITLVVSKLVRDWPGTWVSQSQLTNFANNYLIHAVKYLYNLGFYPVTIKFVNGFDRTGKFDWSPDANRDLFLKIMADYLRPKKPVTKDLNYLSSCFDVAKTE